MKKYVVVYEDKSERVVLADKVIITSNGDLIFNIDASPIKGVASGVWADFKIER